MIVQLTRNPLFAFAVCVLSGSMALSQQTPPAPAAAPVVRQPIARPQGGMRPGMMQGHMRPGMQGNFRGNMRGGGAMGGGFHIGPTGMWWKNPMVVQKVGLTPEQTKKMDDIFQQSRLQLIDLHADVQKQEVMLEPLLSANPLDSARTMAQIDKVADARANLEKADAKMLLGIRSVLTPDQWTKLRTRDSGGQAGPGGQGRQGGPQGAGAPGGRGRGMRPGSPAPSTSNFVDPTDEP